MAKQLSDARTKRILLHLRAQPLTVASAGFIAMCERALAHTRTRYPLPRDVADRARDARAQLATFAAQGSFAEVR